MFTPVRVDFREMEVVIHDLVLWEWILLLVVRLKSKSISPLVHAFYVSSVAQNRDIQKVDSGKKA